MGQVTRQSLHARPRMTEMEAVTLALTLAITAPTDEKAQVCADMAVSIAASAGLTTEQIDQCKADAVEESE